MRVGLLCPAHFYLCSTHSFNLFCVWTHVSHESPSHSWAGSLNTSSGSASTADSTAAKKILIFKSFSESPVIHKWFARWFESLFKDRYFERTWTWTCYSKIQPWCVGPSCHTRVLHTRLVSFVCRTLKSHESPTHSRCVGPSCHAIVLHTHLVSLCAGLSCHTKVPHTLGVWDLHVTREFYTLIQFFVCKTLVLHTVRNLGAWPPVAQFSLY